jgi:hypothetical protein
MPDFAAASDDDLREAARNLQRQAHALSFRRRLIHGRIAVLESELEVRAAVRRLEGEKPPRA